MQCDDQRKGAEDPPEFWLGQDTSRVLTVEMPRQFEVRLRVYDEKLNSVTSGVLSDRINSAYSRGSETPKWASPREPKAGQRSYGIVMGVG